MKSIVSCTTNAKLVFYKNKMQ